jgi:hypothetical protein
MAGHSGSFYNPSYSGTKARRFSIESSPGKNVSNISSLQIKQVWWFSYNPNLKGDIDRRIEAKSLPPTKT